MAVPPRALIMLDVIESLRGIVRTSDYHHDARTVERRLLAPDEIATTETPWFGAVATGVERVEYHPGGIMACTLPIVVAGAVAILPSEIQTEDARAEACAYLLDDIKHALCGTRALSTRGGNAIMTTIVEQWTDEAHEIATVLENGSVIAYVVVRAQVRFDQTRDHS